MSLMEDTLFTLGDSVSPVREGTDNIPYTKEVKAALVSVSAQLRGLRAILVSTLNRVFVSTEIYRVPRLNIFQERGNISSRFGAFGQTMRFIAYVVYSDEQETYLLRLDDVLSGIVSYMEIQTMDRLFPADKIINIENQIIASLAGIMRAYDSDWATIWGGYDERTVEYRRDEDVSIFASVRIFLDLIQACPDHKKLARVDLHLSHYTYDRMRFTILNGEVESFSFKRDSAIYVPGDRIKDYGSAGAESLLETFVNMGEISAFVKTRIADSRTVQYESALVNELDQMMLSLGTVDTKTAEWLQRKVTLRNQTASLTSDDDDDVFFDTGRPVETTSPVVGSPEENTYWSLQTDSGDEEGDIWSDMRDT